ncbi:MAG: hypothetical protein R3F33_08015 [Planctomycetota bacterium]
MQLPPLLVTGFGPFENVAENPSGKLAARLGGMEGVTGLELPTAYGAAGEALDAELEGRGDLRVLLALGVHQSGGFRLERRSGARPPSERGDVVGAVWGLGPRAQRETRVDLEAAARAMEAVSPLRVWISDDAGGYVCDHICEHVLRRAEERGILGMFLHVPSQDELDVPGQEPVVAALIEELQRQARGWQGAGRLG